MCHLFFQHEFGLKCSAGRIAVGVDVRADGGYVIWWPGIGLPVISEKPMAMWPEWLAHNLSSSSRISSRIRVPDDHALIHLIRVVASAREGSGTSSLSGPRAAQVRWLHPACSTLTPPRH